MESKVCPVCEEGVLMIREGYNETEHKGVKDSVLFFYEECDACGSEQADASLSLKNKRLMIAFRKQVDGLLTGSEVRALRERLKLKQSDASRVFGGGPTAFSKYESDDVAQSAAMDKLLRVADALPESFRYLCKLAGHDVPAGAPVLSVVQGAENVVWHTMEMPANASGANDASISPDTHIISGDERYG
jgi:HTH-type transcriptional regulator/antitoxin MqsA